MRWENRMSVRRSLIPLALLVAACSDQVGPHPVAEAPHFLRWAGSSTPRFTAIGALPGRVVNGASLSSPAGGLSLDRYTVTFWAVRGEQRSVQINYLSSTGDTSSQFLRLVAADPAYVPGLGDIAPGDSVLMTVTIDPYNITVSLGPTGLLFGEPAQLQISYSGAG